MADSWRLIPNAETLSPQLETRSHEKISIHGGVEEAISVYFEKMIPGSRHAFPIFLIIKFIYTYK